jgi:hypothetical protein
MNPLYFRRGKSYNTDQMPTSKVIKPAETNNAPIPERDVSVANVKKYLTAEASLQLYGPVTDEVFEERKAACIACPRRMVTDKIPDEIGFCSSCGCGVSQRARLTVKLTMPEQKCPLGKWGAAKGRHRKLTDRIKAWFAQTMIG